MTGTVHGAYKQLGGAVAAGQLVITVNTEGQVVRDPVGNVVFQGPQAVKLNKDGLVTLTLPASDDSTLEPSGFTYAIVEQLSHVARASYRIVEFQVTNGGTIELADLAATDEAALDPSYGANLNAVLAELDGRLSADEITASTARAATTTGQTVVNVASYDDDLSAAVADAPSSARYWFDKPDYTWSAPLGFNNTQSVSFEGQGGGVDRDHTSTTRLVYTGTGATPAISLRESQGFSIEKMDCLYGNSGFTGTFIDARGNGPANPTFRPSFTDVVLGGTGGAVVTAQYVLDLGDTVEADLRKTVIARAQNGIKGRSSSGYVFAFNMWGGRFVDLAGDAVRNPHQMNFYGVTFENAIDGTAAGFSTDAAAAEVFGLNFFGGGFYDVSQPSVWLDLYGGGVNLYGTRVELAAGVTLMRARTGASQPFNGVGFHDLDVAGPASSYLFEHVGPAYIADFVESGCKYYNGARRWSTEPDRIRYAIQRQNIAVPITLTDASMTVKPSDGMVIVRAGGPVTLTMPDVTDTLLCPRGTQIIVKNLSASSNVDCNPVGGQWVDASYGVTIAPGKARIFISDGTTATPGGWQTVAQF